MDRRRLLGLLPAGLLASVLPSVAPLVAAARPQRRQPAALLVPLTGASASLGLSMQRAAALAQPIEGKEAALMVFDTGSTPAGATLATQRALKQGAMMILGPLFGSEVRAVVAAAGRVPVLTFSNDETLRDSGAFLLGLTATQSTAAILGYARGRGIRQVALLPATGGWATQCAAAAARSAGEIGLQLVRTASTDLAALRQAGGGELPDALFVADGGEAFAAAGHGLDGSGVQLLGTVQAQDSGAAGSAAVGGAWIAAPDPAGFGDFLRSFEQRNGGAPGAIAALAYDGSMIVRSLAAAGRLDRAGLLQTASFPGVTGTVRFREDGSATRALAILIGGAAGYVAAPT